METTYFKCCEYDVKIPKALIWKKDNEGYYLDDVIESFYDRKYGNMIDNNFVSLRTDHIQLILPKKKSCIYYLNLENIINNLLYLIDKFPTIHIIVKDLNNSCEDIDNKNKIIEKIKQHVSNRIEYILVENENNQEIDIEIDIYFNYHLEKYLIEQEQEKQKKKSWFWGLIKKNDQTNTSNTPTVKEVELEIKLSQTWEIHFLSHNHGLHILNPEFLIQYYS
jgi:hypothetical protein